MAKVRGVVKGVERDCDLDLGDFECKIVLSVLGKDTTPIKDIAHAFIREITFRCPEVGLDFCIFRCPEVGFEFHV